MPMPLRPLAETMPIVTDLPTPNGSPTASTTSPRRSALESANASGLSAGTLPLSWTTAHRLRGRDVHDAIDDALGDVRNRCIGERRRRALRERRANVGLQGSAGADQAGQGRCADPGAIRFHRFSSWRTKRTDVRPL